MPQCCVVNSPLRTPPAGLYRREVDRKRALRDGRDGDDLGEGRRRANGGGPRAVAHLARREREPQAPPPQSRGAAGLQCEAREGRLRPGRALRRRAPRPLAPPPSSSLAECRRFPAVKRCQPATRAPLPCPSYTGRRSSGSSRTSRSSSCWTGQQRPGRPPPRSSAATSSGSSRAPSRLSGAASSSGGIGAAPAAPAEPAQTARTGRGGWGVTCVSFAHAGG